MDIRRPEPHDVEAALAFFGRVPEGERTFFRERVLDGATVAAWFAGDPGRRGLAVDAGEVIGYVAVVPLPGWSGHVGEVRLVVDPERRRRGVGRALARWALVEALAAGLSKLTVEVVADQAGAVAMFQALGFRAEGLLRDHVRDDAGTLRDLVLLAHPVTEQWAAMASVGIDEAVG
jgi:ribosomal protein S18 acetylase RimI-like enzyme